MTFLKGIAVFKIYYRTTFAVTTHCFVVVVVAN